MKLRAALHARWMAVLRRAERRLPALTRLRAPEGLPIELHRRRIYVIPTRFGAVFALMLAVMSLGALNYNNNAALLLTCLLAAVAFLSVLVGFRNLDGLSLLAVHAEPCFAGSALAVELSLDPARRARHALRLQLGPEQHVFAGPAGAPIRVVVSLPTSQRGWLRLPRLRIWTTWPYGMFGPWSWLSPQVDLLVYPHPAEQAPPLPPTTAANLASRNRRGSDDLDALRTYRHDDPMRLIAWKASARHDRLLVREQEQNQSSELVFEYDLLHGLEPEARIARLTRWVCDAELQRRPYSLLLPGLRLGPDLGPVHRHNCLRELALL
ncbi:MAG: DUF58 domain-containing protein [Tahibacter sp.]